MYIAQAHRGLTTDASPNAGIIGICRRAWLLFVLYPKIEFLWILYEY